MNNNNTNTTTAPEVRFGITMGDALGPHATCRAYVGDEMAGAIVRISSRAGYLWMADERLTDVVRRFAGDKWHTPQLSNLRLVKDAVITAINQTREAA